MRIVHWNVNHRASKKRISPRMCPAISSLKPDILVLTEYVPGPDHSEFTGQLASAGLGYCMTSEDQLAPEEGSRVNYVLIASNRPIVRGDASIPVVTDRKNENHFATNMLHITQPSAEGHHIDVLGLRIPDYSKSLEVKRMCWDWVLQTAQKLKEGRCVIIGDFNTDQHYSNAQCGPLLDQLTKNGWQWMQPPADQASYIALNTKRCRIDHAFASPSLVVKRSDYVEHYEEYVFSNGDGALSDHAAHVIDIELNDLVANRQRQ